MSSLTNSADETEWENCYNKSLFGPFQTLLKFGPPGVPSNQTHVDKFTAFQHPTSSKLSQRQFYVPHLALRTSSNPKDLVLLHRNGELWDLSWYWWILRRPDAYHSVLFFSHP